MTTAQAITGPRREDEPDLMTPSMVAAMLGMRPNNLYGKNTPKGMPEPYQVLSGTTLYRRSDIEPWAYERAQAKGTP